MWGWCPARCSSAMVGVSHAYSCHGLDSSVLKPLFFILESNIHILGPIFLFLGTCFWKSWPCTKTLRQETQRRPWRHCAFPFSILQIIALGVKVWCLREWTGYFVLRSHDFNWPWNSCRGQDSLGQSCSLLLAQWLWGEGNAIIIYILSPLAANKTITTMSETDTLSKGTGRMQGTGTGAQWKEAGVQLQEPALWYVWGASILNSYFLIATDN